MPSSNTRVGILVGGFSMGQGPGSVGMSLRESVEDHLGRVQFFLAEGTATADEKFANWCLLAAVYSAVATFEIVRTRYEEILRKECAVLIEDAKVKIRHFELLEIVRVHDFHRGAVGLSNSSEFVTGPIRGRSGSKPGSAVAIVMDPSSGRVAEAAGRNASMSADRMLHAKGFSVLDPAIDAFVPLPIAIEEYIADLRPFIDIHFPNGAG